MFVHLLEFEFAFILTVLVWVHPESDPETKISVQVIYLRGAGNMDRSMGYGERKATNKEYIIKPASTVGPWSLIPQGNSEKLCKMGTSQPSQPSMQGNRGICTLIPKSCRLRTAPVACHAHGWIALLGSGEKPSGTRMQRPTGGTWWSTLKCA